MEYQVFRGADVKEALDAVRASLGPDALIASTQQVAGDRRNGLGGSYVEITAAPAKGARRSWPFSDDVPLEAQPPPRRRISPGSGAPRTSPQPPRQERPKGLAGGPRTGSSGLAIEEIEAELSALRSMLEELHASRPARDRVLSALHSVGIEGKLAKELSTGASKALRSRSTSVKTFLLGRLRERLRVQPGIVGRGRPLLVSCVGPTGVGKTTTLAKLAARARLDLGRSVAIVSLDCFRVGAVEQWQRYAQLMGVPFQVARSAEAFVHTVEQSRAEIVLVDTPGRSGEEDAATQILATGLASTAGRERHSLLVLPAWLRARDAERVVNGYRDPALTGVVISKLDETSQPGGVLHGALPTDLPVAYLCDGPRVPEDIHDATQDAVLEAVFAEQP